ncbi:MAG: sugar phosphate nucleotidyltransferase [bacterium]|nr:sugar phosphate nucleotidyltransferase [bacterium]
MKVIIPVAGVGSRLRPHTLTVPKPLLTVAGAPMLDYILLEVERLNPDKVVFIIGHLGEQISEYVKRQFPDLPAEFRWQTDPEGLGQAVSLGLDAGEEEVLIILGDTLFETDLPKVVHGEYSSIGTQTVEDPRRFGVVVKTGLYVTDLVEKPEQPISKEVIVGIYWLRQGELLREVLTEMMVKNERVRGEFQLTTALHKMVERGTLLTTFEVPGWYDCGKVETLLETNRHFLQRRHKEGHSMPSHCVDTVLIPPVSIASTASVSGSVIGPYVTIGSGASVCNSVLKNCIVERGAKVSAMLMSASVIGPEAEVSGTFHQLNISELSEIKLVH